MPVLHTGFLDVLQETRWGRLPPVILSGFYAGRVVLSKTLSASDSSPNRRHASIKCSWASRVLKTRPSSSTKWVTFNCLPSPPCSQTAKGLPLVTCCIAIHTSP